MVQEIQRESENNSCLWLNVSQKTLSLWDEIYARFDIQGVIRLQEKDYDQFPEGDILTHFNLEVCHHEPGKIYALPKIITPGFFLASGEEKLPVLDFSGCFIARCLSVRERVPYEQLTSADFTHSFLHMQSIEKLKKEILIRYKHSLPDISDDDLISRGVSITTLQLIKKTLT